MGMGRQSENRADFVNGRDQMVGLLTGLLGIAGLLGLAACQMAGPGDVTAFDPENTARVDIDLPANAAPITQHYRLLPHSSEARKGLGDHIGIDIKAAVGTPILAAAQGRVTASFYEPVFGHQVYLDHGVDAAGPRLITKYFHLKERIAEADEYVRRGDMLGTLGLTGTAAAIQPHLHFEVHQGQGGATAPVNPHGFWLDGTGKVTCFSAERRTEMPRRLTYPVACN